MVCKIKCAAITGIDTQPVIVETDICNGLPSFDMVGLLASNIKESRERVRTAIKNSGFMIPPKRITINFSPANIRKTGTYFDLPVAVSILMSMGLINCTVDDKMFIGELSLNGDIVKINGVLPLALSAMEQGIKKCYVPIENVGECDFIKDLEIIGVENLNQLVMILTTNMKPPEIKIIPQETEDYKYDFKNIKGQIQARKASEIAAAGMHNMLMMGSPGVGKSIIAKTMPSILPDMTLEENLCLGNWPKQNGLIDWKAVRKKTKELLAQEGLPYAPDVKLRSLSVSDIQMIEILKAVCYDAKIIIMDEPTSAITTKEVAVLFKKIAELKARGTSIIYISHKMDEIFEICDEISVLRDGNLVMTKSTSDANMNELIAAMVGRSLDNRFPPVDNVPKGVILSIQNLSTKFEPHLQDVSFDVREGEIFGLYGLVGAGRTELLETIFGVRTRAAGRVYFNNRLMNFNSAREAMEHGFAMITEERKANGLFLKGDLTFNTTIANLEQYKTGVALSDAKMIKATGNEIKIMHTKCMGPDDMISSLSGGNQQKVIFGKWLERGPRVFMMD